mgnify:CR=1 FL=1
MKALFISNDPTIFDATSAARARMRTYAVAIGELHILSSAGRGAKEEQDGNLFLHPVRSWKLFRVRVLAHRAHKLVMKYGIEVVSAQDPFEHGLAALRAVRGTSATLHIQVHTDFLSPQFVKSGNWRMFGIRMAFLNRYRRKIADHVLPAANGIRAVSHRVKNSLIARYGSRISRRGTSEGKPDPDGVPRIKEVSVIPITVSAEIPPRVQLPPHTFNFALIAVGRLELEKHVEDILTALSLVVKRYPMIGLFIVGEGREHGRLLQLTQTLNLEKHVVFLGERTDAWALMGSAQAFIQASAYEGYGRTLIEAALARIPIITTDVGIVGEVFKDQTEVLVAPVADPKALARNIVRFIEDNRVRQELPTSAAAAAQEHLSSVGDLPTRIFEDLTRASMHS